LAVAPTAPSTATLVKVTLAAGFGGVVEYFDLFIASLAGATVWPQIFFGGGVASNFAFSIASVGIAFVVRPIGGFVFGHIGDRVGRRDTLFLTLTLLGLSVFGIGVLPTYAQIGVAAPILLFLFRGVFGLGLGGEYGGGVSYILEFAAKSKWRSFWSLWAAPVPVGLTLGAGIFTLLSTTMSSNDFLSYGWRSLFLVGAIMIAVGFAMRYRLEESPLFAVIKARKQVEKSPAMTVLKKRWKEILALASVAASTQGAIITGIFSPFSLTYLSSKGVSPAYGTAMLSLGNALAIITFVASPYFSEKMGRRKHLAICVVWAMVTTILFFPLVNTLNLSLIALAYLLPLIETGFCNASVQAIMGETFPIKERYSGSGLSYQVGLGFGVGAIVTFFTPPLLAAYGVQGTAPWLAGVVVGWQIVTLLALFLLKETKNRDLSE